MITSLKKCLIMITIMITGMLWLIPSHYDCNLNQPCLCPDQCIGMLSGINSASNGIDGVTDCNFIFFFLDEIQIFDQSLTCVAYSIHMIHENILLNQDFFNWDISHHGAIGF